LIEWNLARNQLAQHYDQQLIPLREFGILPMKNESGTGHVYHLYVVRITEDCPIDRTALQMALQAHRIQSGIHYPVPCHLQPAFQFLGHQSGAFPTSERLSQEILSLPMYPGMTLEQASWVVEAINRAIRERSVSPKKTALSSK
jgi:dTDP-4-amino-4,6-dideoxygalactose transaminase